jgi:hypothetical protein
MKVKVVKPFADKETFRMYKVGQVIDLPDNRASYAVSRGLVAEMAVKVPKNVETANEAPEKKTATKTVEKKVVKNTTRKK